MVQFRREPVADVHAGITAPQPGQFRTRRFLDFGAKVVFHQAGKTGGFFGMVHEQTQPGGGLPQRPRHIDSVPGACGTPQKRLFSGQLP